MEVIWGLASYALLVRRGARGLVYASCGKVKKKKAEVYALCVRDLSENKLGEVHAGLCTRRVANLDEKKSSEVYMGGGGKKRPGEV